MSIERVIIVTSPKPGKEYTAIIVRQGARARKIHFGEFGVQQYPEHKDDAKKAAWIARHGVRERWDDPLSAGFWSRWLLWNKKTLEASAQDIQDKFGFPVWTHLVKDAAGKTVPRWYAK